MSKTNMTLTKTCMSCGQQKPLSAFLQLTELQGAAYGNICASCRKTLHENVAKPKDTEESTTSTTKETIDSKTKVKSEIDKRKFRQEVNEKYFKERGKKSGQEQRNIEKKILTAQRERNHREEKKRSFLEDRTQSFSTFLDKTKSSLPLDKTKPSVSITSSQKEKMENHHAQTTDKMDTTNLLIRTRTEQARRQLLISKQPSVSFDKTKPSVSIDSSQKEKVENRPTQTTDKMDATNPLLRTRTEQVRNQPPAYTNAFINSLPRYSPLAQAVEKMLQQKEQAADKTNEPAEPEEMSDLNDFVRKNFPGK